MVWLFVTCLQTKHINVNNLVLLTMDVSFFLKVVFHPSNSIKKIFLKIKEVLSFKKEIGFTSEPIWMSWFFGMQTKSQCSKWRFLWHKNNGNKPVFAFHWPVKEIPYPYWTSKKDRRIKFRNKYEMNSRLLQRIYLNRHEIDNNIQRTKFKNVFAQFSDPKWLE